MSTATTQIEPAAATVQRFIAMLEAHGWCYRIEKKRAGSDINGVLWVQARVGHLQLDCQQFARDTWRWNDASDSLIDTVRTGSPKHLAIIAITDRMTARTQMTEWLG